MDEIDRLILQAAGLSTYSSPPTAANGPSARHIKNRKSASKPNLSNVHHQQYLRRTTSLRFDRGIKQQHNANSEELYTSNFGRIPNQIRAKDDLEIPHSPCTSPVPPPCPPLRGEGFYASPGQVESDQKFCIMENQLNEKEQQQHSNEIYVTRDDLYSGEQTRHTEEDRKRMSVELRKASAPKPPQRTVSFLCNETFL